MSAFLLALGFWQWVGVLLLFGALSALVVQLAQGAKK